MSASVTRQRCILDLKIVSRMYCPKIMSWTGLEIKKKGTSFLHGTLHKYILEKKHQKTTKIWVKSSLLSVKEETNRLKNHIHSIYNITHISIS